VSAETAATRPADLGALARLPCDSEGPVFREPWEAQAFALVLSLHAQGAFAWTEWAEALGAEIKRAQDAGDPDTGETYYHHWLAALERLAKAKRLVSADELALRRDAWDRAVRATPHGKPIVLET
jgi:nitrile hydratase accessory protein